jgi:hypothetical protein
VSMEPKDYGYGWATTCPLCKGIGRIGEINTESKQEATGSNSGA